MQQLTENTLKQLLPQSNEQNFSIHKWDGQDKLSRLDDIKRQAHGEYYTSIPYKNY